MSPITILVPLDGSTLAEAVLGQLDRLGAPGRMRVVLLRVVHRTHAVRGDEAAAYYTVAELRASARSYLERMARRLARQGIEAEVVIRAGDAAQEILGAARDQGAQLIAMGTHGRTGLSRVVLGSVAQAVVRRSPVPVMLVRGRRRAGVTAASPRAALRRLTGRRS
jgi:nucleotide-binding universal stress UspA family protein